jgi:hypothetical protein
MAQFTRVNGDAQPVFALDTANGPIAPATATAGSPVQPQGPKLDFFGAVANTTVAGEQGVNEYVAQVIQAIQQTATVAMYQVDGTTLSFAVYPQGAFAGNATVSAAAFLAAANVTYTGFQLDSATNLGFKLAAA